MLSDPNNKFVKTLVYIYSMESFIFKEINKASRDKDISMIEYYGPFASALGYIVHCGNIDKTSITKKIVVYRGLKVHENELQDKYTLGNKITLTGFTSSTLSRKIAISFATKKP